VTRQKSLHFEETGASSFPNCGQMRTKTATKRLIEFSTISNGSTNGLADNAKRFALSASPFILKIYCRKE